VTQSRSDMGSSEKKVASSTDDSKRMATVDAGAFVIVSAPAAYVATPDPKPCCSAPE